MTVNRWHKIRLYSRVLLLVFCVFAVQSCRHQQLAYISDAEYDSAYTMLNNYGSIILPGDRLYIHVSSQPPQAAIPFNQESHGYVMELSHATNIDTSQHGVIRQDQQGTNAQKRYVSTEVTGYEVRDDGTITFPYLGVIPVVGISQDSLQRYIVGRLVNEGYVSDPVVTTSLMNFRVTVVGEVRSPRQVYVQGTRLTILEAIAMCGDLTDMGRRDNVVVMRMNGNTREITELDLTKTAFLDSPYYYLQQNDIVYVEPIDLKRRRADRNDNIPRYVSIAVSVASIIRTNQMTAYRLLRQR